MIDEHRGALLKKLLWINNLCQRVLLDINPSFPPLGTAHPTRPLHVHALGQIKSDQHTVFGDLLGQRILKPDSVRFS
jgi:hypothetical protein